MGFTDLFFPSVFVVVLFFLFFVFDRLLFDFACSRLEFDEKFTGSRLRNKVSVVKLTP